MLDSSAKHNIESAVEAMSFSKMNEAIEKVRGEKTNKRLVLKNYNKNEFTGKSVRRL
jgi:D-arabinose 1-dehydrogenase-like Zn-dependent alcohol dehydrogenase